MPHFYIPLKHQKSYAFQVFSGVEKEAIVIKCIDRMCHTLSIVQIATIYHISDFMATKTLDKTIAWNKTVSENIRNWSDF